jgi:hypothetical protein
MKFVRDEKIENRLNQLGHKYEYLENVPYDQFEVKLSLEKNSRLHGQLNKDHLLDIMISDEEGEVFPPLISFRMPNGKFFVLAGNHRIGSIGENGQGAVATYVLLTDDTASLELLAETDNIFNGIAPSQKERAQQAINYCRRYPAANREDVAKRYHITRWVIDSKILAEKVRDVLLDGNVLGAKDLPQTVLSKLHQLNFNHSVMVEAGRVACRCTSQEAMAMVDKVRKEGKSEAEQRRIIELFKPWSDSDDKKPVHDARSKDSKLRAAYDRAMVAMVKLVANQPTLAHCAITASSEKKKAVADWIDLREKLDVMHGVR